MGWLYDNQFGANRIKNRTPAKCILIKWHIRFKKLGKLTLTKKQSKSFKQNPKQQLFLLQTALGSPTYLFQMTQVLDFNHSPTNGPGVRKRASFCKCDHADDLHFIWGVPFIEGDLTGGATFTNDETELSRHVMRYFVNFARSG